MWQYHDSKLKELKKTYNKVSKQTQNRLQEIFDSFNITFDNLYNIADTKSKIKIDTYIEEWKDKGLLQGYFGMLANNIYRRTRVKNSEILELLIYSAYVEEQNKLQETELNTFKDVVNHYYQEGQKEVNKKKKASIIPDAIFLALLAMPNVKGWTYDMYIQTMLKYNADQTYRQVLINLQQQKELEIDSDAFQNIIKKQQNTRLTINEDKISGDIDLTLIGINNMAKVEGIASEDNNAKVMFLANIDGKETEMCHSLNNQTFYINKENDFDRYYGETQKELAIRRIKCKGLVLGLNLPPISHHFHWCRSTVIYINNKEIEADKKYNIFDSKLDKEIKRNYNIGKSKLREIDRKTIIDVLDGMKPVYNDFPKLKQSIKSIKTIEHPYGGLNVSPDIKDNKMVMEVNKKFFKSQTLVKENYEQDVENKFHPQNSTYKHMGIHELGHCATFEIIKKKYSNTNLMINDWNQSLTSKEIVQKAFNNLGINDKITQDMLRKNISTYSKRNYSENIAEAFVDYYANKNNASILSKEIIKVMKGMI